MKKVLAVVAIIAVVFVAGSALAQPRARDNARRMPPQAMPMQVQSGDHVDQRNNPQFPGESWYTGRGRENFGSQRMPGMPGDSKGRGRNCGFGRGKDRMMFAPDMPEEIRDKLIKAEKLRIDLRVAFNKEPLDKAELLEIFSKIQKAEKEAEAWRFEQRINRIEDFRKQQELNRRNFNAPEKAPEAPAEIAE